VEAPESEAARLCAAYHIARARLLVDCLADSERDVIQRELRVTLGLVRVELDKASTAIGVTPVRLSRARVDLRGHRPVIQI
jgi:hypothetical protein